MVEIHALTNWDEMREAVHLQQTYWGNDLESVVPVHMLHSIVTSGGHVLGAYVNGGMVGVLIGFIGTLADAGEPAAEYLRIFSKRMVVLKEHRGAGIGEQLKLRQRDLALHSGITCAIWTFDPLLAANAHLNIRKLGAICRTYLPDYYGVSDDYLAPLGSSDRLRVEWWLDDARVTARAQGEVPTMGVAEYAAAGAHIIIGLDHTPFGDGQRVLLEIPTDYPAIINADAPLAMRWRQYTRHSFMLAFEAGYRVKDFVRSEYEGAARAFYVLER